MKITITTYEAEQIVRRYVEDQMPMLKNSNNLGIEIEPETTGNINDDKPNGYGVEMKDMITIVRSFRFRSDQKIAAIKSLRDLVENKGGYMSLIDTKYFVEALMPL